MGMVDRNYEIRKRQQGITYLQDVIWRVYECDWGKMKTDVHKCVLLGEELSDKKPSDVMAVLLPIMVSEAKYDASLQHLVDEFIGK